MNVPVVPFPVTGRGHAGPSHNRPYTVVYDGACRICGRLVRVLRSWDREETLEIIASQSPGVQARFPWIPAIAYRDSIQLIGPSGRTWQGAAAIEQLLDVLPKGRFVSWMFSIPGMRPLSERAYRWVARNRYRLGCGEHCRYGAEADDQGEDE